MPNENFRRELNNAIDQMSGSPSPALRDRVRSSLSGAPAASGHYWIAAVAAAVIAVLLVGVLVVANPLNRPSQVGPIVGSPTPTPSAPGPSPTPAVSPTASPSLPAMICGPTSPVTTSPAPAVAYIDALRTGTHPGYDRLTIEFKNGSPASVTVDWQTSTTFTQSPSGQSATVQGTHGMLITIRGADLHTDYSGLLDIKTGYTALVEIRRVQDFEGVVQLGLGISGQGCYRWFFMSSPDRLVIDIQTS